MNGLFKQKIYSKHVVIRNSSNDSRKHLRQGLLYKIKAFFDPLPPSSMLCGTDLPDCKTDNLVCPLSPFFLLGWVEPTKISKKGAWHDLNF